MIPHLAVIGAAASPEKRRGVPTWLADRILLLRCHRYSEARDLRWIKVRMLFKRRHHFVQRMLLEGTAALNSIWDGPMGHGFGYGDANCIDWHQRHVVRVFSAFCPLAV